MLDTWMDLALREARAAEQEGEVPVGAVLIQGDQIVAAAHNRTEQLDDPSAHAEILVLREAGTATGDWRLEGSTLVATLEPCPMCLGAIIWARVDRLIYGAGDPRYGACGSALPLPSPALTPHLKEIRAGYQATESSQMLQRFFRDLRRR